MEKVISAVSLGDWESHEDSLLVLSEYLNVIIGKSHQGKSGIIRAFDWAINNNPVGTGYFPRGKVKPESIVAVEFSDESFCTRRRTKTKNQYETSNSDEPFKALKSGVPAQVSELFNMAPVNLQLQKDVHFMLNISPGKRAKMLNDIAGLDDMDKAIDSVNKRHRKLKTDYDNGTARLDELEEQFNSMSWVDNAEKDMADILDLERDRNDAVRISQDLHTVLGNISAVDKEISALPNTDALADISRIFRFDDSIAEIEIMARDLKKLLKSIVEVDCDLKGIDLPTNARMKKFDLITAALYAMKDQRAELKSTVELITSNNEQIHLITGEVAHWENTVTNFLREYDICPFCGGEMSHD